MGREPQGLDACLRTMYDVRVEKVKLRTNDIARDYCAQSSPTTLYARGVVNREQDHDAAGASYKCLPDVSNFGNSTRTHEH